MAPSPYANGQGHSEEMAQSGIHGKPSPLSNRGRDTSGRNLLTRDCEHDPRWAGAAARFSLSQKGKTRKTSESELDPICRRCAPLNPLLDPSRREEKFGGDDFWVTGPT